MNYRELNDADLVDFSKNVELRLAEHEVTSLPDDLADDLAATIAPLNVSLETVIESSVENTALKQSVNAVKLTQREEMIVRLSAIKNYLVAAESPKSDFEICGFSYRKNAAPIIAQDPTDLAASGTSNGVNRLRFRGNNPSGSVNYEVWRREGDTAPWAFLLFTGKQQFSDAPVVPGQYYEYKVRAVAKTNTSYWSNSAVVYGAP